MTQRKKEIPIRGVMLDFDGTITEPFFDWQTIKSEMGIGDMLVLEAMEAATSERREELETIMSRWERKAVAGARIREGVHVLLTMLKEKDLAVAVVTNNNSSNVSEAAGRCGLNLPPVLSRDCGHHKPSTEFIKLALEITGTKPEETVIVGDSRLDIVAGSNSGLTTVLIGEDKDRINELSPDYHVRNIPDLILLLDKLTGAPPEY
jgi:pyrophosphatase PpaX